MGLYSRCVLRGRFPRSPVGSEPVDCPGLRRKGRDLQAWEVSLFELHTQSMDPCLISHIHHGLAVPDSSPVVKVKQESLDSEKQGIYQSCIRLSPSNNFCISTNNRSCCWCCCCCCCCCCWCWCWCWCCWCWWCCCCCCCCCCCDHNEWDLLAQPQDSD